MRNDIRNTLILSILLLIILLLKIGLSVSSSKKINKEKADLEKNKTELASLANVQIDTMQVYNVKLKIAEMDKWQAQNGKYFLKEDNTKLTWSYITNIINTYCPDIELNYEAQDENNLDPNIKTYKISGSSNPESIVTLINHLESQPLLYTIDEVAFASNPQNDENGLKNTLLNFEITFSSHINNNGSSPDNIRFRNITNYYSSNFFVAKLYSPENNPEENTKINTTNLILLSLTPTKAFVKDNTNRVYILKPGDRVAYGYLDRINWKDQSISFKINKIGIFKELTINLNKE